MTDGGDIANNNKTPGLLGGANVLFNNPWTFLPPGSTASRPAPSAAIEYRLRLNTDDKIYEYYDTVGAEWVQIQNTDFTVGPFVTYTADVDLPQAQNLGALSAGLIQQTVSTGIATLSTAVNGVDYYGPGVVIPAVSGGTGVNNGSSTITVGGNTAFSGPFTFIGTLTGNTGVTFPTSGTLATTGGSVISVEGTADEVLVNGTSGTPITGAAIVLSTPQAIATTSSPTFASLALTSPLTGANGGTGVNNGASLITVGGNTTFSGAFAFTGTLTNTTSVTFPTSGTLVNTAVTTLSSLVSIGTITTGTWNATVITGQYGGTGVANTGSTITVGGNVTYSGAFTFTGTLTGNTSITYPTTGTLVNTAVTTLSSLASIGTITTGVWQATPIDGTYINYNTTNFQVTASKLNTIQNINPLSPVVFASMTLNGSGFGSGLLVTGGGATVLSGGIWSGFSGTIAQGTETDVIGLNLSNTFSFSSAGNTVTQLNVNPTFTINTNTTGTARGQWIRAGSKSGAGTLVTGISMDVEKPGYGDTTKITARFQGRTQIGTSQQFDISDSGVVTAGTWNATLIPGQYGGTGVANTGKTITIGGNTTFSGAFAFTGTLTNTTSVTFPTSGTLATTGGSVVSLQGTASQVLVNGTSGSPVTGTAITLTTPQNIGTSSDVSFGSLAVNTSSTIPISSYSTVASSTPFASSVQYNLMSQNSDATNNNWQIIAFQDHNGFLSAAIGLQITNQTNGTSDLYFYTKPSGGSVTQQVKIASTGAITLTQLLTSSNGGTGNGFTKFSGPTTSEKTFTLPNASDTIACLATVNAFTAQQYFTQVSLTDASPITWNLQTQQVASVLLTSGVGATRQLQNPTNQVAGAMYFLKVIQSSTGSNALTYGTSYKWPGGTAPVLSTANNAIDILSFYSDGTNMYGVANYNFQ